VKPVLRQIGTRLMAADEVVDEGLAGCDVVRFDEINVVVVVVRR
jgi:hypothetical protein